MGIGQPDVVPLAGGVAAQPLVSPMAPAVNPDSVSALVDAFRKGAIGMADIQDRIGAEAMAQKRAHIEQLHEYVSPEAIQSRMAQHQAASAQADLQTRQASAQADMVKAQSDYLATKLAADKNAVIYGPGGTQAIQELGPRYGVSMEQFRLPDGTYNLPKASQKGNEIASQEAVIGSWYKNLVPITTREIVDANGKHLASLNKDGVDVSPPAAQPDGSMYPGSPGYWNTVDQLNALMPKTHPLRAIIPSVHPSAGAAPYSYYNPGNEQTAGASAEPLIAPRNSLDPGHELPVVPIADPPPSPMINAPGLAPGQPVPVVAASGAPSVSGFGPPRAGGPVVSLPQTAAEQREEIRKSRTALAALPRVNEYEKASDTYDKFADSARRAPIARNGATDLGLAENYSKMHDPNSTIREFKFDALKQVIPLLERFKDAAPLINKSHIFPDNVRAAIIEDGLNLADASERGLVSAFQSAEATTPGTLNETQKAIASGIPFSQRQGFKLGTSGATATANNNVVTVGGRKGYILPNGMFKVTE